MGGATSMSSFSKLGAIVECASLVEAVSFFSSAREARVDVVVRLELWESDRPLSEGVATARFGGGLGALDFWSSASFSKRRS